MPLPKPDDLVTVQRTVIVSQQQTLQDLADAAGEPIRDVILAFKTRSSAKAWIEAHHVAEMVPYFDRSSEADGDTLDFDTWSARLGS